MLNETIIFHRKKCFSIGQHYFHQSQQQDLDLTLIHICLDSTGIN